MKPELPSTSEYMDDASTSQYVGRGKLSRHFDGPAWQLLWDSLANMVGLPLFLIDEHNDLWQMSSKACVDCFSNTLSCVDLKQLRSLQYPHVFRHGPYHHLVSGVVGRAPQLTIVSGCFYADHASDQPPSACPGHSRIPPSFTTDQVRAKHEQLTMIARIVEERLADKQMMEHWSLFEPLGERLAGLKEATSARELYERVAEAALELPGVEATVVRELRGRSALRVAVRGSLPVEPPELMRLGGSWGRSVDQGKVMALSSPMDDPGIMLTIAEPLRRYRTICSPLLCGGATKAALFVCGRSMPIAADEFIFKLLEILRHSVAMVLEILDYESRMGSERRTNNACAELIHMATVHTERRQLISAMADLAASLWGLPVLIRESHLPKADAGLDEHPLQIAGRVYGFMDLPRIAHQDPGFTASLARFCGHAAAALMIHDLLRGGTCPAAAGKHSDKPLPGNDQLDTARFPLSPREQEIIELISRGRSNKQIAQILGCSESTVKTHVSSILRKMDARDRTEAAVQATKERPHIRE